MGFIYNTPIEDLGFKATAFDESGQQSGNNSFFDGQVVRPLLLEVKQFRNLSKPYQRVTKYENTEKIALKNLNGVKKDHTFQLIAHDGVRFIKLILLMPNQA